MNEVMRVAKDYELDMSQQRFDEKCWIDFRVREAHYEAVKGKMEKIEGLMWYE
jgi:hypothetical protein